jgi:hypothetical protein
VRLYNILYGLHGHLAQYPLETVRGWDLKPHMACTGAALVCIQPLRMLFKPACCEFAKVVRAMMGRQILVSHLSNSIAELERESPLLNLSFMIIDK